MAEFRVGDTVTIGRSRNRWVITKLETWTDLWDREGRNRIPDRDVAHMRSTMSRRTTCKPVTSLMLYRPAREAQP